MLIFIKIFFPACHIQLKEEEKKKLSIIVVLMDWQKTLQTLVLQEDAAM